MSDLLPCPFCGGVAEIEPCDGGWKKRVKCTNCWAATPGFHEANDAIDAWNTRAERTCHIKFDAGWGKCSCGSDVNAADIYCNMCGAKVVDK